MGTTQPVANSAEDIHTLVGHLILPWRRGGTTEEWNLDRMRRLNNLVARGVLQQDPTSETGWSLTEKGVVYVRMMLATPEPVRIDTWKDPRR